MAERELAGEQERGLITLVSVSAKARQRHMPRLLMGFQTDGRPLRTHLYQVTHTHTHLLSARLEEYQCHSVKHGLTEAAVSCDGANGLSALSI